MSENKQSIYIVLVNGYDEVEKGEQVAIVSSETIENLNSIVNDSQKLQEKASNLREQSSEIKVKAHKLLKRIIKAYKINYDKKKEAVGISREDGTIYIGEIGRVIENSEAPPQENDRIIGQITKHERKKYEQQVRKYNKVAQEILSHNDLVQENEDKLISFEEKVLNNKEYDKDGSYLVVVAGTGKVFLCNDNN